MEEHRPPRIHLIPTDDSKDDNTQKCIANTAQAKPDDAFYDSSVLMQRIGSSVIHYQAAIINRRLLNVQKRAHDEDELDEERPRRRPRKDTTTPNDGNDEESLADEEQVSIFSQVERMKRMSHYLKNARIAQEQFLRDMQECLNEGNNVYM